MAEWRSAMGKPAGEMANAAIVAIGPEKSMIVGALLIIRHSGNLGENFVHRYFPSRLASSGLFKGARHHQSVPVRNTRPRCRSRRPGLPIGRARVMAQPCFAWTRALAAGRGRAPSWRSYAAHGRAPVDTLARSAQQRQGPPRRAAAINRPRGALSDASFDCVREPKMARETGLEPASYCAHGCCPALKRGHPPLGRPVRPGLHLQSWSRGATARPAQVRRASTEHHARWTMPIPACVSGTNSGARDGT